MYKNWIENRWKGTKSKEKSSRESFNFKTDVEAKYTEGWLKPFLLVGWLLVGI